MTDCWGGRAAAGGGNIKQGNGWSCRVGRGGEGSRGQLKQGDGGRVGVELAGGGGGQQVLCGVLEVRVKGMAEGRGEREGVCEGGNTQKEAVIHVPRRPCPTEHTRGSPAAAGCRGGDGWGLRMGWAGSRPRQQTQRRQRSQQQQHSDGAARCTLEGRACVLSHARPRPPGECRGRGRAAVAATMVVAVSRTSAVLPRQPPHQPAS